MIPVRTVITLLFMGKMPFVRHRTLIKRRARLVHSDPLFDFKTIDINGTV